MIELNPRQKAIIAVQKLNDYLNEYQYVLDEAERLSKEAKATVIAHGETIKVGQTTVVFVKEHQRETLGLTASALLYSEGDPAVLTIKEFIVELCRRNKLFAERIGKYFAIKPQKVAAHAKVSRK